MSYIKRNIYAGFTSDKGRVSKSFIVFGVKIDTKIEDKNGVSDFGCQNVNYIKFENHIYHIAFLCKDVCILNLKVSLLLKLHISFV